jgi:hypothetical protein
LEFLCLLVLVLVLVRQLELYYILLVQMVLELLVV